MVSTKKKGTEISNKKGATDTKEDTHKEKETGKKEQQKDSIPEPVSVALPLTQKKTGKSFLVFR